MNAGYVLLIIGACVVPALLPLMMIKSKPKNATVIIETKTFEDLIFDFETSFIQTVYKYNYHLLAFSPQSAMIMLWVMGYGAPDDIKTSLQMKMKLRTLKFEDLTRAKSNFRRGIEGLLHHTQTPEYRKSLGWSWNMTVDMSDKCVEQVAFTKLLRIFDSSITNRDGKPNHIQIVTTESFNPQLSKFHLHCISEHPIDISKPDAVPIRSLVSEKMQIGQLPSLHNTTFYGLSYNNISIYFLDTEGITGMKKIMSNFSRLKYEDFEDYTETRCNLKMPIGRWADSTSSSEFRPFFTELIPTFPMDNKIKGDFSNICDLKTGSEHDFGIRGRVTLKFETEVSHELPKCDQLAERMRKSGTKFINLEYPFVVLIMINKSIIYFNVIHHEPK